MANSKITDLTELTSVANDDVLVIVDDSASETKKITFANLSSGISVGAASEVTFTAKNDTGSSIAKGKAVYISGASGSDTTIALAANTSASTMPAFGITKEAIANNSTGAVVLTGTLSGINTSSFSEGDELYVSTSGDLTATKPTGTTLIQKIAKVAKAAASGSVVVTGAGRSNDIPNIPDGQAWIGNSSGVATPTTLADVATSGDYNDLSNTPNANELDGQVLEVITRDTAYTNGSYEGHVMKYRTDTIVELKWYILGSLGWTATDADEEAKTKGLLGLALGTSSGTNGLLIRGVHQSSLWSSFTVGQTLYLSTTEGTITATAPTASGDFVRVIGYAMGSNNIYIDPAQDYIELS